MSEEKPVHVKSYVKDDGTRVKEHYRGLPDRIEQNLAELETYFGGVTKNVSAKFNKLLHDDKMYNYQMKYLWKSRNLIEDVSKRAAEKSNKALNKINKAKTSEDIYETYKLLSQAQDELHEVHYYLIDQLAECNETQEYKKLYKDFEKNRNFMRVSDNIFRDIENSYNKGNYADMQKFIKEYHSRTLERENYYKDLTFGLRNAAAATPAAQKKGISYYLWGRNKVKNINDAYEMWIIAADNFAKSEKYLQANGAKLDSISYLPIKKVRSAVYNKVKKQMHVYDSSGIILHSESSLSKAISNNEFFRSYIKKYKDVLNRGESVDFSIAFSQSGDENLHLSLGNADVIDMHIDKNGYLRAFVIDTYDFNEDDRNWMVEIAHNVQEHGLITNYFVVVTISVPMKELEKGLK